MLQWQMFQIENHKSYDSIDFHHLNQWNKELGVFASSLICQLMFWEIKFYSRNI